ncbi:SpoIIE family protein phosphatase [Planctomycetota bacterium]|nr:SpoIIE family protein phosphatase [Planctomycetota bacterium]
MMFIALPPLIFLSIADHLFLRELGDELSIRTHNNLVRDAQIELRQLVDSYARIMERELGLVSLLLYIQTEEAQQRLNAKEIDGVTTASPLSGIKSQSIPPTRDLSQEKGEAQNSRPYLDFEKQSIFIPPDEDGNVEIKDQIARLSSIDQVLKQLYRTEGNIVLWNYIALTSGLHLNYPGNVNIPDQYDPRKRAWFQQTVQESQKNTSNFSSSPTTTIKDEVRWFPLIIDSLTGQVTITATLPIRDLDGKIIGVSGIDLNLTEILSSGRLPAQWSNSRLLLVALANPETNQPFQTQNQQSDNQLPVPVIIADTELQGEQLDWKLQLNVHPLAIESPRIQNQFVQDMLNQQSGIINVVEDGNQAVWGYASIGPRASLLVIVPFDEIDARASVIREIAQEKTWQLIRISTVVLLGVIILVVVLAWSRSRTVTEPILRMARAAEQIASGDLNTQVNLHHRSDEIGQLAKTFNSMVPKLQDHVRLSESIDLAMQVQQSLLPSNPPIFPHLDIAGRSVYCDETGGDYYDFLTFDDTAVPTLGIAVGDVVGHGIAAALLMATTRALLRIRTKPTDDLKYVFKDLNHHLCDSRFTGKFMTMYYMQISQTDPNSADQDIKYLSAGHDPVIVFDVEKQTFSELVGTDIPLGVLHDWPYNGAKTITLSPCKLLIFGTDGIWETRNSHREFYGKDRLKKVVQENAYRPASHIADAILQDVSKFQGESLQEDDITLVVVKLNDSKPTDV